MPPILPIQPSEAEARVRLFRASQKNWTTLRLFGVSQKNAVALRTHVSCFSWHRTIIFLLFPNSYLHFVCICDIFLTGLQRAASLTTNGSPPIMMMPARLRRRFLHS